MLLADQVVRLLPADPLVLRDLEDHLIQANHSVLGDLLLQEPRRVQLDRELMDRAPQLFQEFQENRPDPSLQPPR